MKLIDYLKTKFDHIVVFDYEFQADYLEIIQKLLA